MAFACVNKSGLESVFNEKPIRKKDFWHPSVIGQTSTLNVWEGDILEGSNKGEICFEQGAFLIRSIDDNTLYSLSNYTTWDGKITCKVIGNKFDKEK